MGAVLYSHDERHPIKLVILTLRFYKVNVGSCFTDAEIESPAHFHRWKETTHFRIHRSGNPKLPNFLLLLPMLEKIGYELRIKFVLCNIFP